MLYSEFTKLAGFDVRESYYHEVIEPEYNRSTLDKADWVKQWKKDGGIQKAYDAQVSRYEDKAGEVERLREMNENQANIIRNNREVIFYLQTELERNKIDPYELLIISEKYSCSELREKVIEMIGFKEYISYKFENDMNIWQLDRDEILKRI